MKKHNIRRFSLVEVLVAVAILLILMTFVFQFTNGAQRLLTTTREKIVVAEDASTIFQIMEEDFSMMVVHNQSASKRVGFRYQEDNDPSAAGKKIKRILMFTVEANSNSLSVVEYYYKESTSKLHRFKADITNQVIWNNDFSTLVGATGILSEDESDEKWVVSDKVSELTLPFTTSTMIYDKPKYLKVSLVLNPTMNSEAAVDAEKKSTFSKVFFFN